LFHSDAIEGITMDSTTILMFLGVFLGLGLVIYETVVLRNRLRRADEERKRLMERLEALEHENRDLRTFIEELSKAIEHRYRETSARESLGKERREIQDSSLRRKLLELKILKMYEEGVPVSQIAKAVGLSRVTVYRIPKKYRR